MWSRLAVLCLVRPTPKTPSQEPSEEIFVSRWLKKMLFKGVIYIFLMFWRFFKHCFKIIYYLSIDVIILSNYMISFNSLFLGLKRWPFTYFLITGWPQYLSWFWCCRIRREGNRSLVQARRGEKFTINFVFKERILYAKWFYLNVSRYFLVRTNWDK